MNFTIIEEFFNVEFVDNGAAHKPVLLADLGVVGEGRSGDCEPSRDAAGRSGTASSLVALLDAAGQVESRLPAQPGLLKGRSEVFAASLLKKCTKIVLEEGMIK